MTMYGTAIFYWTNSSSGVYQVISRIFTEPYPNVEMTRSKNDSIWRLWYWLAILPLVCSACHLVNGAHEKKLNRRLTLWRQDKIPYGCYAAYENLSSIFPNAEITLNKRSPIF